MLFFVILAIILLYKYGFCVILSRAKNLPRMRARKEYSGHSPEILHCVQDDDPVTGRYRLARSRTPPSHGGNSGSNPDSGTKKVKG